MEDLKRESVPTSLAEEDARYLRAAANSISLNYMFGARHSLLHKMKSAAGKLENLARERDELLRLKDD
jgi:hypothetical protein